MGPVGGRGGHLADKQKLEEVGQSRLASDEGDGELSAPAAGVYVIDSCFIVDVRRHMRVTPNRVQHTTFPCANGLFRTRWCRRTRSSRRQRDRTEITTFLKAGKADPVVASKSSAAGQASEAANKEICAQAVEVLAEELNSISDATGTR